MRQIYVYSITFFICVCFAHAQSDTLVVNLKNNQKEKIAISDIKSIRFENITSTDEEPQQSTNLNLNGNFPNPFGEQTNIEFEIAEPGNVEIIIYDNTGNKINTLKCENCKQGKNQLQWNCLDFNNNRVSNGVYFYEVRFDNEVKSKKMIVVK